MSLKKKIAISFFISAGIIALLAVFEYVNFNVIKNEIRFLELTDTVRSKSLQLRRHEKNYFLYSPAKSREESEAIHRYLDELDSILAAPAPLGRNGVLPELQWLVRDYRWGFDAIEVLLKTLNRELRGLRQMRTEYAEFFPLVESAFYERPRQAAQFLRDLFKLPPSHSLLRGLEKLDEEIAALRKNGEGIINVSKELDRQARDKVERGISISQAAIIIVVPLFLATGVVMLFLITRNIVNRLNLLSDVVEKTGKGNFAHVDAPEMKWGTDEVGTLIRKFDHMEGLLVDRQAELEKKNQELVQVKKLAAIGTLAAGVAHELNNPLNNIYLSTQVLTRELGNAASPAVREVADDILGQTKRVKKIVADLLEFARGREPRSREVELNSLITAAYARSSAGEQSAVRFLVDADPAGVLLQADPEQMEQVFINLFTNAQDAMEGSGTISVQVIALDEAVTVRVADNGPGIPRSGLDKVFEPFYTTKDKGTGLGLAIVFNIIKKHYGEITVESEEGQGTAFTIRLPRKI
ncbi:MAG: ATP-binding protein [Nitrospirota bacterium]|nr:ATP-binding protein [Nitrospirota bacterium]